MKQNTDNRADTDLHVLKRVLSGLFWLRNVAVVAQLVVVLLVVLAFRIQLDIWPLLAIIAALWLWNLLVGWRLSQYFPVTIPVTFGEIAWNLGIDMLALATLLYWAGGSTNPFVSMFLVPVALAAVFLPARYVVTTVVLATGLYTALLWKYVPLATVGSRFGGDFNLHIWGMWASFILSAVIAAIFVYKLACAGRRRERELAEVRETLMRNEHIVSAGALAAGIAHEMNTPLSTIGLLSQELVDVPNEPALVKSDAREILAQVNHCKTRLQQLQQSPQPATEMSGEQLRQVLNNWAALRSDVAVKMDLSVDHMPAVEELGDFMMAMTNLLNNAADASLAQRQAEVNVSARYTGAELIVEIDDFGKGLSTEQTRKAGRTPFSSKENGLGLGLVLSHATLERIGGELTLMNRTGGGLRTRLTLPITDIER